MKAPKIETYSLKTSDGKHIRKATKAVWDDGQEIKFLDYIPSKVDAENQAIALLLISAQKQVTPSK